ncbi:PREDICTED: complement component C1q receptor [Chinchilla lanigera]|uniref:CD93 molecule n=1 Tax=Chinchilla lanigera TaxID=34839 RepID=A0A8C2VS87_CHILA|nr:PREDICTED: complement component C1q receptor [Chinchilla lanigera]
MAGPRDFFLLLLLGQPWAAAAAHTAEAAAEAVVCSGTACYTAHWGKLSAAEAQDICSQNGGNLATVKSEEEARLIQRSLAQLLRSRAPLAARMGKFWVGLQREKGKCLNPELPLKGFSWVGGGEDTEYTNWHKELKSSCLFRRCVALILDLSEIPQPGRLLKWTEGPCGSYGNPGSSTEGFVCKFSFKGMCRPLALGGPGQVNYSTPFRATASSLDAVPFASLASVVCEAGAEQRGYELVCREKVTNVFDWGNTGPLCINPELGCSFSNGGCEQDCFEGGAGSFRCGCRPGFRLRDDLVSCASRNPCSSSPCKGEATCVLSPQGDSYTCHCPHGYQLDASQLDCIDVDECQDEPCAQECVNTDGGFLCECWVGYTPGGPGEEACVDVDECAFDPVPCTQHCTNTPGSFHCSCQPGYVLSGENATQCEDEDECADPVGNPCRGPCSNVPGSFRCGCLEGWMLAPDGLSCVPDPASSASPAGLLPEDEQAGKWGTATPTTMPHSMTTSTRGSEDFSTGTFSMGRASLSSDVPTSSAHPKVPTPSRSPGLGTEPGTPLSKGAAGHGQPMGEDSVASPSEDSEDGQSLLLFYILGTVVAISLLLALALGLLVCRKRRAKREIKEKKSQNAADRYAWVPERAEGRENQYSPTPGSDC